MKTRNLALLLLACIVAGMIAAFMASIQGLLPSIAIKFIIVFIVLLALASLWVITWLAKGIFKHIGEIHAEVNAGQARRYELAERRERWTLEREERLTALHLQLSRVSPGTYLIRPEAHIVPSEQDVIFLPAGPARSTQNQPALPERAISTMGQSNELPTNVRYEEIRGQVPRGHILVGIGSQGVETRTQAVGACVWIVGLSGTGKTSTTVLRVEERKRAGHKFLGVDPHFFKDDSLTNAVTAYRGDFLMPMATTPEETLTVLQAFLSEFKARKAGHRPKPWQPITLLIDETNALMDATTPEEEEAAEMLPSIARICGQEARNFNMGGIFVSQQATGLAWLRKVALMVIVHQLLMESEKKLACNGDMNAAQAMKTWPIGRTYIYGVGFQDGPRTVQQPYFQPDSQGDEMEALQPAYRPFVQVTPSQNDEPTSVDTEDLEDGETFPEDFEEEEEPVTGPRLSPDMARVLEACQSLEAQGMRVSTRKVEDLTGIDKDRANPMMHQLQEMGLIEWK